MTEERRVSSRKKTPVTHFVSYGGKRVSAGDMAVEEDSLSSSEETASFAPTPPQKKSLTSSGKKGSFRKPSTAQKKSQKKHKMGEILSTLSDPDASVVQLVRDLLGAEEELGGRLVLFVMELGGCSERVARRFLSLEDLEACDWTLDEDDLESLARQVAESADCFADESPLETRKNQQGEIQLPLAQFFNLICEEGLLSVKDGAALGFVVDALIGLANTRLSGLRLTGTVVSGYLSAALSRLMQTQNVQQDKALRQLKSKVPKDLQASGYQAFAQAIQAYCLPSTASKRALDEKAMKSAEKEWRSYTVGMSQLEPLTKACLGIAQVVGRAGLLCEELRSSVLSSRYRDSSNLVRVAAAAGITELVVSDVVRFLPECKVCIEPLLLDKDPEVRAAACTSVSRCLQASTPRAYNELAGGDMRQNIERMATQAKVVWSKRVKRIVLDLLQDKSPEVSAAAVSAIAGLGSIGQLELADERAVERCLCYDDHDDDFRPVRRAAAEFLLHTQSGLAGEDRQEEQKPDELEDEDDDRNENHRKTLKATRATLVENESEDAASTARARVQLASLIDLIGNLVENRIQSKKQGQKADGLQVLPFQQVRLVIDAFWGQPGTGFLRNWEAMLSYLLSYGEHDIAGDLGPYKAQVLANILRASVECLTEEKQAQDQTPNPSQKDRRATQQRLNSTANRLQASLLRTLPNCLTAFRAEPLVLEVLLPLALSIDAEGNKHDEERTTLARLSQVLSQLIMQHTEPYLLLLACRALYKLAKGPVHVAQRDADDTLAALCTDCESALLVNCKQTLQAQKGKAESEHVAALGPSLQRATILARVLGPEAPSGWLSYLTVKEVTRALTVLLKEDDPNVRPDVLKLAENGSTLLQQRAMLALAALEPSKAGKKSESAVVDAKEFRHVLQNFFELAPSSGDDIIKILLPCYLDSLVLFSDKLAGTELEELAWEPSEAVRSAFARVTDDVIEQAARREEKDESELVEPFDLPSVIRTACLAPAVRCALFSHVGKQSVGPSILTNYRGDEILDEDEDQDETAFAAAQLLKHLRKDDNLNGWIETMLGAMQAVFQKDGEKEGAELAALFAKSAAKRRKTCTEKLAGPVVRLVVAGARWAMAVSGRVSFFSLLVPFVHTLKDSQLPKLREEWTALMAEGLQAGTAKDIFGQDDGTAVEPFQAFESALGVQTRADNLVPSPESIASRGKRKRFSSGDEELDDPQEEAEAAVPTSPKRQRSPQSAPSSGAESRREIEKDLAESDTESIALAAEKRRLEKLARTPDSDRESQPSVQSDVDMPMRRPKRRQL